MDERDLNYLNVLNVHQCVLNKVFTNCLLEDICVFIPLLPPCFYYLPCCIQPLHHPSLFLSLTQPFSPFNISCSSVIHPPFLSLSPPLDPSLPLSPSLPCPPLMVAAMWPACQAATRYSAEERKESGWRVISSPFPSPSSRALSLPPPSQCGETMRMMRQDLNVMFFISIVLLSTSWWVNNS